MAAQYYPPVFQSHAGLAQPCEICHRAHRERERNQESPWGLASHTARLSCRERCENACRRSPGAMPLRLPRETQPQL